MCEADTLSAAFEEVKSGEQERPPRTGAVGGLMKVFSIWVAAVILLSALWAAASDIDTQKSVMTVRVLKSGMFSAFGHEHEISAPIKDGKFSETDRSVDLTVDARQMRVMDKDVSEKDRAEIQETMLGPKVLDTARFPEIHFRSTAVEPAGAGRWSVTGESDAARANPSGKARSSGPKWTLSGHSRAQTKGLRNRTHRRGRRGGEGEKRAACGV